MNLNKCFQNKKFIFIFIILTFFKFSKSDECSDSCINLSGLKCKNKDEAHECPAFCKPKYGFDTCHDCSGIQNDDYNTISQDNTCLINQCIGDKIIQNGANANECTYQIINPDDSLYKVGQSGDYYYYFSPNIDNDLYSCTSNKICNCVNYYYIETIYGKKNIIVLMH